MVERKRGTAEHRDRKSGSHICLVLCNWCDRCVSTLCDITACFTWQSLQRYLNPACLPVQHSAYRHAPLHNTFAIPSTATFHPPGNPGASPSEPSHPAAIAAITYKKLPLLGKYGVGTRVPPVGYPASSNEKSGSSRKSMACEGEPRRAADSARRGKSHLQCERQR